MPTEQQRCIAWERTLAQAIQHMDAAGRDELLVVDCGRVIGRLTRKDVQMLIRHGNWPFAVMVRDAMRRERKAEGPEEVIAGG
jgi:hypothetical protein